MGMGFAMYLCNIKGETGDKNRTINRNLTKRCEYMKLVKKIIVLVTPLLLFVVLVDPYMWVNGEFIVKWLGCGCVENNFNANDFTALFWLFISICVTTVSVFLSKRIPREKIWLRVLYILGMFLISLLISYQFSQMMMWC